jgi:hypothetical protein
MGSQVSAFYHCASSWFAFQVGGNVKVFEGISFLTVKGCGHTVQSYCPQQGYDYYHNWLTEGKY